MNVLVKPSLNDAKKAVDEALRNKQVIVIIGKCYVDYKGRSESRLTEGERIVIIKPDGSLLVHRPQGYKPVNWQPDSMIIETYIGDHGELVVKSIRGKPREIVWIYFKEIKLLYTDKLTDHGEFVMYIDEHEIRDLLHDNPEFIEKGLKITAKEYKIGSIGYADLFGIDSKGNPVIIEVKRVTATREAVIQLYQYVREYERNTGRRPRGILVAPSFSVRAIEALQRMGLEWKEISLQKLWKLRNQAQRRETIKLTDFF